MSTRPDLPSPKAANFAQRLRETVMTYLGQQGDPLDRGVTLRDLTESGLITLPGSFRGGSGSLALLAGPAMTEGAEPDLTPPPTPTGFSLSAAIQHVFISHDEPLYLAGGGHLRTRVYGLTVAPGDELPTFLAAVELTQFGGTIHAYPSDPATTWRIWIKWETKVGVLSSAPAGGTNGLEVTTAQDVERLLAALNGQLSESQLVAGLNERIDLIDGFGAGSVNLRLENQGAALAASIAQETLAREDAIAIESHQRLISVQSAAEAALNAVVAANNERTDRLAEVAAAKTELTTTINAGLSAEAAQRTLLAAQMRGDYTGNDVAMITSGLLYQERIARVTQDDALALQITLLSAGVGEEFDWAKIWYFDTGVESWSGNGAPSASGGFLRPANQASGAYVTSPTGLAVDGAKYKQVRIRIRKVGAPTFSGYLWWAAAAEAFDVARRVALTAPSFDANGIGVITLNTTWTGTIDKLRLDLSDAQTGTDYFEIDWFAVGRPSPGASTAQLLEEQGARAAADSAEATSRETLATAILGQASPTGLNIGNLTAGLIFDEKQARSTQDAALASSITSLQASVTALDGDVTTLSSTVTEASQAAASAQETSAKNSRELLSTNRKADAESEALLRNVITGHYSVQEIAAARQSLGTIIYEGLLAEATARLELAAKVNVNAAAITSEQLARASADSAMASDITTLFAGVGANTAAISTEASARASETGELFGKYTVKVDVNGYVSGFGLASTANNGVPFSEFAIVADKFSIAPVASNPAAADGSPFFYLTLPTVIGGVEVPAGAYMKAAFIHDATITNAKIADLAVDNAKIASLSAAKVTFGEMSGQRIATKSLTADRIATGTLSATEHIIVSDGYGGSVILHGSGKIEADGALRRTVMSSGNVTTYLKVPGVGEIPYQSLSHVEVGVCDSGVEVTIPGYFETQPRVQVSPASIPTYSAAYQNQGQTFNLSPGAVTETAAGSKRWKFTPTASLSLASGVSDLTINVTVGPQSDNNYTSGTYQVPANTATLNVSMRFLSFRRFVLESGLGGSTYAYNYRKVTWYVEYSADGISGWTAAASRVVEIGATSTEFANDTTSVALPSPGAWYWRVRATAEDSGVGYFGVFSAGNGLTATENTFGLVSRQAILSTATVIASGSLNWMAVGA